MEDAAALGKVATRLELTIGNGPHLPELIQPVRREGTVEGTMIVEPRVGD